MHLFSVQKIFNKTSPFIIHMTVSGGEANYGGPQEFLQHLETPGGPPQSWNCVSPIISRSPQWPPNIKPRVLIPHQYLILHLFYVCFQYLPVKSKRGQSWAKSKNTFGKHFRFLSFIHIVLFFFFTEPKALESPKHSNAVEIHMSKYPPSTKWSKKLRQLVQMQVLEGLRCFQTLFIRPTYELLLIIEE